MAEYPMETSWRTALWRQFGAAISFLELHLYNLRHVQEHAAQLSLFLGQHAIQGEALDWVARAQEEPGS